MNCQRQGGRHRGEFRAVFPGSCLEDWDGSDRCERDLGSEPAAEGLCSEGACTLAHGAQTELCDLGPVAHLL